MSISESMTVSEPIVAEDDSQVDAGSEGETVIESDSLVEEVSIDGMCGVY